MVLISSTTLCATSFLSSRMTVNQIMFFFFNDIWYFLNWVLTWNCATWRLLFFSAGPSCQVSFQCQSKHSNPDWQEWTYKSDREGTGLWPLCFESCLECCLLPVSPDSWSKTPAMSARQIPTGFKKSAMFSPWSWPSNLFARGMVYLSTPGYSNTR